MQDIAGLCRTVKDIVAGRAVQDSARHEGGIRKCKTVQDSVTRHFTPLYKRVYYIKIPPDQRLFKLIQTRMLLSSSPKNLLQNVISTVQYVQFLYIHGGYTCSGQPGSFLGLVHLHVTYIITIFALTRPIPDKAYISPPYTSSCTWILNIQHKFFYFNMCTKL